MLELQNDLSLGVSLFDTLDSALDTQVLCQATRL